MISVVIPTFNREKQILRALESVLKQSYQEIEVIIVDDGSTDNTLEVLKQVKDSRVKVYSLGENKGANAARNYGIHKSQGEYIAFQDSDDVWDKKKLEMQLSSLEKNQADIICCALLSYDLAQKNQPKKYPFKNRSDFLTTEEVMTFSISTQTLLFHRRCFEEIYFDEEMPRFQDWDLLLRMQKKYSIYYLAEVLVDRYESSDSISINSVRAVEAYEKIYLKNQELFKEYPDAYANFLYKLGIHQANAEIAHTATFAKSLRYRFTRHCLIKFLLSMMRIY